MSNFSKKTKESWSSLPDAVALSCLARVPRSDYANVSLVSRRHRSLVASPELCLTRSLIGCTEPYLYVCLHIVPEPTPRWFVLTRNRRLEPIPSNPDQPLQSSSFVVVDWGIYVIGGTINGDKPTSDVWFLDCYSNTWRRLPSMKMPRASPSASFLDGKIYVFGGGCGDSEVFDPKTQTWSEFVDIHPSVVIENKKVVDAVDDDDDEDQSDLIELLTKWIRKTTVPETGNRNDWCAIGNLFYCIGTSGRILWCEQDELDWKEVKGLKMRQNPFPIPSLPRRFKFTVVRRADTIKLCSNSAGNIVIISKTLLPKNLTLCSEEISLERREGGEIWGKTEWFGTVFQLDPLSLASSFKVLFSASVHV